jgi:hypothetical protein
LALVAAVPVGPVVGVAGLGGLGKLVQPAQEPVKVGAGEAPVERHGGLLVAALEAKQPLLDLGQVGEVVRGQDLALDDGEVALDLVEPEACTGRWISRRLA